jgi:hypothetical protein
MDVQYYLENVYANLSARPQPLTNPGIGIVRAFDVFGICKAESETISQVAGKRLRKGSFVAPYPFSVMSPSCWAKVSKNS